MRWMDGVHTHTVTVRVNGGASVPSQPAFLLEEVRTTTSGNAALVWGPCYRGEYAVIKEECWSQRLAVAQF